MFTVIVATDLNNGIGKDNGLPWKLKGDMKYFKETTLAETDETSKKNVVIMGRKTWESIPEKFRPLPNRLNIVVSRTLPFQPEKNFSDEENVWISSSLDAALKSANARGFEKIFVIGGAELYKEAFSHKDCEEILLTRINKVFDCDTFVPEIDESFVLSKKDEQIEDGVEYSFNSYKKWHVTFK